MGYIYKIVNRLTGKMYIGETAEKDPEERWRGHQHAFRQGRGCPALRDAIQKYGIENFQFEVMVICFDEARFEMERLYIRRYNTLVPNGYNILEGGVGGAGFKGKTHSEETRRVISEHSKRIAQNPEYRKRMAEITREYYRKLKESGVDFGRKVKESEKFRKAVEEGRVGNSGRIPSDDTKKKTSESLKAYFAKHGPHSVGIESHRKAMATAVGVKVEKYDLEDKLLETYDSIADAARMNKMNTNSIRQCLLGKYKTAGGFKWKRATVATAEAVKNEVVYTT